MSIGNYKKTKTAPNFLSLEGLIWSPLAPPTENEGKEQFSLPVTFSDLVVFLLTL
jgi:hypothetical protein